MVHLESPVDVTLLSFFDVKPCSVGIWNIFVCISWCLSLVLATSTFFWVIPAFYAVPDVPHLLNHDFSLEFPSWSFCCLVHRFFLPCIPLYLLPMSFHLVFPMLGLLLSLLCCSSGSSWVCHILSLLLSFPTWWFWLSFLLTTFPPLAVVCPCYLLSYWLDLFLKEYLSWYSFFLECVIVWSCNLVASNTILLVSHLACEVPGSISSSRGLSIFQMFPLHLANTAFTWLKLLLLLVVLCHRFHSFFLLVALSLIRMLLVSISHLVLEIVLLL